MKFNNDPVKVEINHKTFDVRKASIREWDQYIADLKTANAENRTQEQKDLILLELIEKMGVPKDSILEMDQDAFESFLTAFVNPALKKK